MSFFWSHLLNNNLKAAPFLEMGFRPFFMGAALFAIVSMTLWSAIYLFGLPVTMESITMFEWHAHEMLYGYAFAVIAGFLLTSVRTWTKLPTAHGRSLLFLFLLWLMARILLFFGTSYIQLAAIFDITFACVLSLILTRCIVKAKQWQQLGIVAIVLLFTACNIIFYSGVFAWLAQGVEWGIYGGLYLVIALILVMGRRVIPFFIERASGGNTQLYHTKWADISSILLFIPFAINALLIGQREVAITCALLLFVVNAIRLIGWYRPIIWQQSLLWSIYLAFWMITLGFLLVAASSFVDDALSLTLAIHTFAVGGIAVITLGLMARVSLGHTGNNVYQPPRMVAYALSAITLCAVVRVTLPYLGLWPYDWIIALSQGLWLMAFLLFIVAFYPILISAKKQ